MKCMISLIIIFILLEEVAAISLKDSPYISWLNTPIARYFRLINWIIISLFTLCINYSLVLIPNLMPSSANYLLI